MTDVSDLLNAALRDADDPSTPVSVLARKALRIARLRNDWEAQWMLQMESLSLDSASKEHIAERVRQVSSEIAPHLTRDEYTEMHNRLVHDWLNGPRLIKADSFSPASISDCEGRVAAIEQQIEMLKELGGAEAMSATAKLNMEILDARRVLSRQRDRIADYLSRSETQIHFGEVNADIFARNREYVEERLKEVAPQVLGQFSSAYKRHAEVDDPEARSQALMSCRRVLKSLADALYPATGVGTEGVDGRTRIMGDDRYISRLCQFATDKALGTASRDLVVSAIAALGKRLDNLNSLASKGVHDNVSAAEVDQCLLQTFTVAGDLLRIADDRSAALI
jgi:hypothetical protein